MTMVAWSLLALAVALGVAGHPQAALFTAIASLGLALGSPTDEQADARRRNHAHRVRTWQR